MPRGAAKQEGMDITMSQRDRDRLVAISALSTGQITQKQAAQQMGISVRQVSRLLDRYKKEGDAGLIHRARGKPSNRRIAPSVKERVITLLKEHYSDFGPTHAAEKFAERHGLEFSKETVRKWMIEAGLHKPKRRKVVHLQWRERRPCFGELLQIDGSQEAWLEGRGGFQPDLINAVDDATGRVFMQFAPAESTEAVMRLLHDYITRYGRPLAIYADRHSIYQTNREATVDEQLQGREAETQLGRALRELRIEYIPAGSPQAKGRVERSFRTLQDRLIREMRLEDIGDMQSANRYLKEHYIDDYNERFAVEPASDHDAHRSAEGFDLDAILSHREIRTVMNDYTISYYNTRYQVARESVVAGLRGGKVTVEKRLDGSIHVRFGDDYLTVCELPPAQPKVRQQKQRKSRREPTAVIPAADHPWRQDYRKMPDGPIYP
jgi:transposase